MKKTFFPFYFRFHFDVILVRALRLEKRKKLFCVETEKKRKL
jgi:hypothetical protein